MKYALDIKDSDIRDFLMKRLREDGHLTIDCLNEECCLGESFFKKVLLSNSTKSDLFVRITFDIDYEKKIELWGDENILRKVVALNLEDMIEYLKLGQICIKSGSGLYLVKNLESLCLIMNISDDENEKIDRNKLKEVLYKIINEVS